VFVSFSLVYLLALTSALLLGGAALVVDGIRRFVHDFCVAQRERGQEHDRHKIDAKSFRQRAYSIKHLQL
jgi:hypothetical protein